MAEVVSNNKRIAKNTIFLYVRMLFVLFVSLYTSRVVLNTLGVDNYGIYNVVAGFVSMFGFLNVTLSSSMQRFYNFESSVEGKNGYLKVYSTGLIIHLIVAVLLVIILETFGLWYLNNIMVVPEGRLTAANFVYQASILSMVFVVLQIPYSGAIMADERMDFYAIVSIIDVLLKLIAVIALPKLPYDKLITYGCLMLAITIFDTGLYFIYAKRKVLDIKVRISLEKSLFKSILFFSGWNLLGTFAFLLKGQGVNILLNAFFGTVINAARGIAYQVNSAISGFSANLSTAFRPQIVSSYALNDFPRTRKLFFFESKVCFALLLTLMIPVIIEMKYLLHLWLGDIVPECAEIFSILVLVDSLICSLNTPCSQVAFAVGNIKDYQIFSSVVNVCLLPVCWIFLKLDYDSVSVFVVTIFFSVINQIVCLIRVNKIFPFGLISYIREVCIPCVLIVLIDPVFPFVVHNFLQEGFLRLLIVILVDIAVCFPSTLFLVFSKIERNKIMQEVRSKVLFLKSC